MVPIQINEIQNGVNLHYYGAIYSAAWPPGICKVVTKSHHIIAL